MVTVDIRELKLNPQSVVLDAGCGTGRHLRELARIPQLKIIGIDKNEKEIGEAIKSIHEMPDAASNDVCVMEDDIKYIAFCR